MSPSVKPFNEEKYKALMDGLECSEILKNDLERTLRIDSEFYKKENLNIGKLLQKIELFPLTYFTSISDGNHMSISDKFVDKGVPYYRGQDVKSFFIEDSHPICIDEESFDSPWMLRSHLQKGDVLLSIVGTIGKLSLVNSNRKATCSCKLAILRPKKDVSGETIATFLTSKYGQNQIKKYTRGAVQMGLILEDMEQLLIPNFSKQFIAKITELFANMNRIKSLSIEAYEEANYLLLKLLSFEEQPELNQIIYAIKPITDSFNRSGRLDAEYYHPKYDALFYTLSKHKTIPLGGGQGLVYIKKSIEPGSDAYLEEGVPFIRVSDVDKYEISTPSIRLSKNLVPNIKDLYPKKDTILLSKDGSIGIAYKINRDMEAVTSGALLHLTVKNPNIVLPDYLTLVLNSSIVQLQAERDCSGAVIQHWKPSDIEKVLIPILDMAQQQQISNKVEESFRLRNESKHLLDLAVKTVEMAIEVNEESALLWLESQK